MSSLPPGIDLSRTPVAPNPNGDPSNFVDPPSLAPAILAVGITLIVISALFVLVRLITNVKHTKRLGWDDYLCLFAEVGGIGYWGVFCSLKDSARHTWDVPLSVIDAPFIKKQYALQMIIGPTMWASKAAIMALYIRVFGRVRWLRFTCYGLLIFTFLFYWSNILIALTFCLPKKGASWDDATTFAKCDRQAIAIVIIGIFGVAADIVLFALPFPVILNLQLGRKKTGLCLVFLIGFLEVIASILSLFYRIKVFRKDDPIWFGNKTAIVTFFEVFGTVIVSCAPALFSFWVNIVARSKLYSSLIHFGFFSSRGSPPSNSKKENNTNAEIIAKNNGLRRSRFTSSSPPTKLMNHTYKALPDTGTTGRHQPIGKPYTEIYSTVDRPILMGNIITKSTTINQQSE